MKTNNPLYAARIELLLSELRLPAIKLTWAKLAEQSDKEGWPAARFLALLAEHEIAERGRRRIERHVAEAVPPDRANQPLRVSVLPWRARRDRSVANAQMKPSP
jgi:DNA replication protein DnaC